MRMQYTTNAWQNWFSAALSVVMQDANQTHLKEATTVSDLPDSSLLLAVLKCLKRQVWETTQGLSFVVLREVKEVLRRGSALSKSTYFPNRGTNSCLNLFWAINLVIWLLCLPMGSLSLFFDYSSFSAMASLSVYCHGYHVALGPPIKPPMVPLFVWLTLLAKGEK